MFSTTVGQVFVSYVLRVGEGPRRVGCSAVGQVNDKYGVLRCGLGPRLVG